MTEMKKIETNPKEWFQILAIISACLPAITNGILFSWSSPAIPRIIADKQNYAITLEEASYFTVIPPIGTIATCFLFSYCSDKFGRRATLLFIAAPQTCALLLAAVATSKWVFYLARFMAGMSDACLFSTLPVYVGEIATPKVRGTWGNLMTLSVYFGQFAIQCYGSYLSIPNAAFVTLAVPALFLLTFFFMPESPYFSLMKGRLEDARSSLQRLRSTDDVDDELAALKAAVERQMSEKGRWAELVTIRSNRRALVASIFLRTSQQVAGVAVFSVYTQFIFEQSGSNFSPSISSMVFSALLAVLNLCASFTLDLFGRKKSYFYSVLLSAIVLFVEFAYFYCDQFYDIDLEAFKWVPLAGMVAWSVFYSFGLGIVPTLMMGELFSASIKGKALCVLNIVFALLISGGTKLFQVLTVHVGLFAPFLLYSIGCFVSTVLSLYFVPETKGKTLEQIQIQLGGASKQKRLELSATKV